MLKVNLIIFCSLLSKWRYFTLVSLDLSNFKFYYIFSFYFPGFLENFVFAITRGSSFDGLLCPVGSQRLDSVFLVCQRSWPLVGLANYVKTLLEEFA